MTISDNTYDIAHADTEAGAGFGAGMIAAEPDAIDDTTRFHSVVTPAGAQHRIIDVEELREKFAVAPRAKKGTYHVHTAVSFCEFVAKHHAGGEVWADEARQNLVAILNANTADGPQWEDHRLVMELVHTPAWKAWTAVNGKMLDQETFAELIEARIIDIQTPSGADMLEIVQTFYATTGVTFKSSKILASGARELTYVEETSATAGQQSEFEIPKEITLGIAPFVGAEARLIRARFRYRINGGRLTLGIVLERPEDVIQQAFDELVTAVRVELPDGVPVYYGRPA
jgi:uncharacterized protein YfdQ (DUF2303 family)